MSFGPSGLTLRMFNVPGSPGPPRMIRKGSVSDRVVSLPSGPIRFPTFGSVEPERQRKLGMNRTASDTVVMRLLFERTLEPDGTNIPAPESRIIRILHS